MKSIEIEIVTSSSNFNVQTGILNVFSTRQLLSYLLVLLLVFLTVHLVNRGLVSTTLQIPTLFLGFICVYIPVICASWCHLLYFKINVKWYTTCSMNHKFPVCLNLHFDFCILLCLRPCLHTMSDFHLHLRSSLFSL